MNKQPAHIRLLHSIFGEEEKLLILDVGACDGEDSIRYKKEFPESIIHAFEPLQRNKELLKNNFSQSGFQNLHPHFFALGKENCCRKFYVSSGAPENKIYGDEWDYGNKSSSFFPPGKVKKTHPWLKFNEEAKVEVKRLDDVLHQLKISEVDFVHLDVQGAELEVLQGAGDFLKQIKCVWMEVEKIPLYMGQPLLEDVEKFMTEKGFKRILIEERKNDADVFYVNRFLLPSFSKNKNGYRHLILNLVSGFSKVRHLILNTSFSQHKEDLLIRDALFSVKPGLSYTNISYVDIGAHLPAAGSNTYYFYLRGARGITVEPDTYFYKKHMILRSRDTQINAAAGESNTKLIFYALSPSSLSTASSEVAEKLLVRKQATLRFKSEIEVIYINDLLIRYASGNSIDILSIDAEGMDETIIYALDFNIFSPAVICVETLSYSPDGKGIKNQSLIDFILSKNYELVADTGVNSIFRIKP